MYRKPLHNRYVAAIAYADVFDYALTRTEAARWAVAGVQGKSAGEIEVIGEYRVLCGRTPLVSLRKFRQHIAQEKWCRAYRIARLFRYIPTITLAGITGGLAMNNVKRGDDIDFFIVTRSGTLWVTRMTATLLAESLLFRRRPADSVVQDKVCLNMFVSEQSLALPPAERDLFSAHEVLQMVPLWERRGAYHKFLVANRWVKSYLPNAWREKYQMTNTKHQARFNNLILGACLEFVIWVLGFTELPCKAIQLWYMKNKRTNEVIRSGMIRFHPRDARMWVRKKFGARLTRWNIPLDKIFYHR